MARTTRDSVIPPLPSKPNPFGDYYLGKPGDAPSIHRSKLVQDGNVKSLPTYYAFAGPVRGFIFDGGYLDSIRPAKRGIGWNNCCHKV